MAASYKLSLVFNTEDGTTTHSYNYANPSVTSSTVSALANGTITNGSIFAKVPLSVKEAYITTTEKTEFTIS